MRVRADRSRPDAPVGCGNCGLTLCRGWGIALPWPSPQCGRCGSRMDEAPQGQIGLQDRDHVETHTPPGGGCLLRGGLRPHRLQCRVLEDAAGRGRAQHHLRMVVSGGRLHRRAVLSEPVVWPVCRALRVQAGRDRVPAGHRGRGLFRQRLWRRHRRPHGEEHLPDGPGRGGRSHDAAALRLSSGAGRAARMAGVALPDRIPPVLEGGALQGAGDAGREHHHCRDGVAVHAEYHVGVPRASRAAVYVRSTQLSASVLGLCTQPIENQVGSGSPVRRGRAQGRQGAPQKIPHRRRDRRDGARGEFFLERLCAGNQPAAGPGARSRQPLACPLVRHRHRAVGALHVLGAGTGRLHLRPGDPAGGAARHTPARWIFRALAGEPIRLQGRVQAGSHRVRHQHGIPQVLRARELTGREPADRAAGEDRSTPRRCGRRPAHDGQSRTGLLSALPERVRTFPAGLQGKPVQPLHAASRSSTATTTRSSIPTTSCPG